MSDESKNLQYVCKVCGQLRCESEMEMVGAEDPKYGTVPLCADVPACSMERVAWGDSGTNSYEITDELK